MLIPWLELPGSHDRVALWSKAAGLDLVRLGTTATAEEITDTSVTQPLVVAAALLAFEELDARGLVPADTIAAGHSVGELAAAAVAGVLSADDAVALAAVRGAEMAKACALEPTGMSAVLGGDEAEVLARLDELGLEPANRNAAGPDRRGRSAVGARGTRGEPARRRRGSAPCPSQARSTPGSWPPRRRPSPRLRPRSHRVNPPALCSPTPTAHRSHPGADALTKLAAQVTRPVRWDLCTASLRTAQVSAIAELPPAGTLVGIAKREMRGTPTLALKTPGDISALAELTELG